MIFTRYEALYLVDENNVSKEFNLRADHNFHA